MATPLSLGKFWTAANVLSLFRVALAAPVVPLVLQERNPTWILGLILLAALTDWFDGRVARWSDTVSNWGKILDPLCDKAAILLIGLALVLSGDLPVWFVAVVVLRDGLIVAGSTVLARRIGEVKMSMRSGKVAVTAMAITLLAALLGADEPVMNFCIWATVVLMTYSFALYLGRYISLVRAAGAAVGDDSSASAQLADTHLAKE